MVKEKARREKRQFTQAFKLEAVRLAQPSGQSLAKVERDLDLNVGSLGRWVREFEAEGQEAFLQQRSTGQQARIRELERRLALVEEERDILKKQWPSSRDQRTTVPIHEGP